MDGCKEARFFVGLGRDLLALHLCEGHWIGEEEQLSLCFFGGGYFGLEGD